MLDQLCIYERPRKFTNSKLLKRFRKYETIVYYQEQDETSKYFEVLAFIEISNIDISRNLHDILCISKECNIPVEVIRKTTIHATPDTLLLNKPIVANNDTYTLFRVNSTIRGWCERIKSIYDISDDDIHIINGEDYYGQNTITYGFTVDSNLDVSKYQKILNLEVSLYSTKVSDKKSYTALTLIEKINYWLHQTTYQLFNDAISETVLGQPELPKITLCIYSYLKGLVSGSNEKITPILAGSSGSGKTETFRAIKRYFNETIPGLTVSLCDASTLSPAGYRGADTSSIMSLIKKAEDGIAIIFLDEIDKKLVTSTMGEEESQFYSLIQNELLTILEGSEFAAHVNKEDTVINTQKTLFILAGSFDAIRKDRQKKASKRKIGFDQNIVDTTDAFHAPITREDIEEYGAIPQLLGRLPLIVNYCLLADKNIRQIIFRKINKTASMLDIDVEISESYYEALLSNSKTEYGCRIFDSLITTDLMNAYEEGYRELQSNEKLSVKLIEPNNFITSKC